MARNQSYTVSRDGADTFTTILDSAARLLLWGGILATVACLGFLVYYFSAFAGGSAPATVAQANANIDIIRKFLVAGCAALAISTSYLFWGEETLSVLQLLGAGALFLSPFFLPTVLGATTVNDVTINVLKTIRLGGTIGGALVLCSIAIDIAGRVKHRAREGAKADQLKYGKGVKEERDIQNVFMGKCWQLPYCRKFVREKCPIYHSRRTCWKERVGCMCEEEVIRNAMSGKVIPKDMVAAAKFIPRNNKLPEAAKAERCRQCVIYNEHQKHKYKLALPLTLILVGGVYALARQPLLEMMSNLITKTDQGVRSATFQTAQKTGEKIAESSGALIFREVLLICFMLIVIAYLMKLIEFLFFKAKV